MHESLELTCPRGNLSVLSDSIAVRSIEEPG
jgi:hypothetical protein